jgi:tRNA(fMet)-specific endonuclease VapC
MRSGSRHPARLALDSSAYHHLVHGDDRVKEHVVRASAVLIPAIVLGELEAGFVLGRRVKENRQKLADLLDEAVVQVVPVDEAVARTYGELVRQLRKAGTPVAVNDIWIAATTIEHRGHLLTFDRDFERFAGLDCTVLAPR